MGVEGGNFQEGFEVQALRNVGDLANLVKTNNNKIKKTNSINNNDYSNQIYRDV